MNKEKEIFGVRHSQVCEASAYSGRNLVLALLYKVYRKTLGRCFNKDTRMVWTVKGVSDATGPMDNVRNYLERRTIRSILGPLSKQYPIASACEVGCGYGRIIMVLQEFSQKVVGFEREAHLLDVARPLLPTIEFCQINSLDQLTTLRKGNFDLAMTCTVLQHLTDEFCQKVLEEVKTLAPKGHILLIEKTTPIMTTENTSDGNAFLSRARSVDIYTEWMKPYVLVSTTKRKLEPGYANDDPGTCMLFRSPLLPKA